MQEKRTLYLAGKITGDPYYFTKFYNAQKKLEEGGFIVVNPALLPAEGFTWEPICVCPALCLQSAPKSVFFRTGKRAKARNMNSAKRSSIGVAGRSFGAGLQSRALLRLGTGGGNNYRISNRRWHT